MPVRCGGSCPRLPAIGAQISLVPSRERIGETNRIFVGIVGIVGKNYVSLGIHCDFALPTFARDAHVFHAASRETDSTIPPQAAHIHIRWKRSGPRRPSAYGAGRCPINHRARCAPRCTVGEGRASWNVGGGKGAFSGSRCTGGEGGRTSWFGTRKKGLFISFIPRCAPATPPRASWNSGKMRAPRSTCAS